MKKVTFIVIGVLCVCLGTIGAFLPILPTTPFLLLAAFLFYRSSQKLHRLLLENRILGKYLSNYFNNIPMPPRQKIGTLSFLWIMLGTTIYLGNLRPWLIVLLFFIGFAVTFHILTIGKLRRKKPVPDKNIDRT